jgi:hypothetical protein
MNVTRWSGEGWVLRPRGLRFALVTIAGWCWCVSVLFSGWSPASVILGFVVVVLGVYALSGVRQAGSVAVDTQKLTFRRRLLAPRALIEHAYVCGGARPEVRVLGGRGLPLSIRFDTRAEATSLLEALLEPREDGPASFRVVYLERTFALLGVAAFAVVIMGSCLLAQHGGPDFSVALWIVLPLGVLVHRACASTKLEVGREGLVLRRGIGLLYLPYERLDRVTMTHGVLRLSLRSRRLLRLGLARGSAVDRQQLLSAIAARIERALERFRDTRPDAGAVTLLDPGGRPAKQWLRDMRALSKVGDYRGTMLDGDRLWRVVEDWGVPAAARAGAAVALSAMEDNAPARIRVAADRCADPKLKRVLVRVSEGGDDGDLEDAMKHLTQP